MGSSDTGDGHGETMNVYFLFSLCSSQDKSTKFLDVTGFQMDSFFGAYYSCLDNNLK